MANAHNVILVENLLLNYAKPQTLERRQELISEIIQMFKEDDTTWFERFATTFPGNEQGRFTAVILNNLSNMHAESPYVFHDYLQALRVAQNMVSAISKLPFEGFQMFTSILSLRPRERDVNAVFNVKAENAPLTNITKFLILPGQVPPENLDGSMVSGFVQSKEKKFPYESALKGRFYLRTLLAQVSPQEAREICENLFMNKNTDPAAKADAASALSHQAMRWAAMVVDRKKRRLLNLESIPVPPSTYSKLDLLQGRHVNIASGILNAAIACSVVFALVASAIPVNNDSKVTQAPQIIQKSAKPRP